MVVVLILLLVLVVENYLLLRLVNRWLENLVRPRVFLTPVVLLGFVLKVMASDIRVSVRNTYVNSLVFEHPRNFSEHFF